VFLAWRQRQKNGFGKSDLSIIVLPSEEANLRDIQTADGMMEGRAWSEARKMRMCRLLVGVYIDLSI